MPVDPPDDATLRSIAQRYGLGLTDADLASFRPFVEGLLASWGAVVFGDSARILPKVLTASGVMTASVPPAIITSAAPRTMV